MKCYQSGSVTVQAVNTTIQTHFRVATCLENWEEVGGGADLNVFREKSENMYSCMWCVSMCNVMETGKT